jgi:cell pole-organizing protein PopZ
MARPGKAERARRQALASVRRIQEEHERMGHEEELAAIEEDAWFAKVTEAEDARAADEYAARAVEALDRLARLAETGDVTVDDVRDVLSEAGHPDFLRDPGWCRAGL